MSSPSSAIACREIFDENSQPSAEEISEYAQQLGIDPESESHLLPLARDGLMQALPAPWKAYYDEKLQTHYYYNEDNKKTQWEHPLDNVYREIVKKVRDSSVQDDTCASVQELLTSEENTKNLERVETKVESDEELSTDSENHPSDVKDNASTTLTPGRRLTPLGRPPLSPLSRIGDIRISPLRRSNESPLSNKPLLRNSSDRDLLSRPALERPKMLFKQQSEIIDLKMHVLNSPEEDKFSSLLSGAKVESRFNFSGKNSFFKISKSDLPSPDTDKSLPLDSTSMTKSDPPKGILREKMTDAMQRRPEFTVFGRPKTASFEEDRKSVRFKLENLPEPTISPGSNSSSEQNDNQSSIISAAPTPPIQPLTTTTSPRNQTSTSTHNTTPLHNVTPSPNLTLLNNILSPHNTTISSQNSTSPHNTTSSHNSSSPHNLASSHNVTSPHNTTASSHNTPSHNTTSSHNMMSPHKMTSQPVPLSGIVLSPLAGRPPLPPRIESPRDSIESDSHPRSPRRRIIRPPAADYIKPDLFQKNFQKIADLVRPGDIEPTTNYLEEPTLGEKEARPRSPMIPQKSKISINLMESIESETSIDSPDREFANLDLMLPLDETNENTPKDAENTEENQTKQTETTIPIPEIKIPHLELSKTDTEVSKSDQPKSPQIKISPLPERSPKFEFNRNWNPLSTYKPLNKAVIAPQVKAEPKNLTSPRLDGVIISQGKTNSDNVVVVYQFETQEDSPKIIKSPLIPDMIERNKADERKRLELSLQKELEGIRVEWGAKERKMRAELQEELKELENKFLNDKRVRLSEQAERHRREMEEVLETSEKKHKAALGQALTELDEKYRRETAVAEDKHVENMQRLNDQYKARLLEQQNELEIENERELQELQDQLQASLIKERSEIIEENKLILKSLREDHAARIAEMKQDYRAEVERLRTQHVCHVAEVRARLAAARAPPAADPATREKYKALKEKYARLKHDVKMSIERRNKRREMSMTTGSETEKSNSHKANPSLERCKELNETSVSVTIEPIPTNKISNPTIRCNDNETSYSESNAQKSIDNNNEEWKLKRENTIQSADTSQTSGSKRMAAPAQRPRRTAVAFKDPPISKRKHERDRTKKDRDRDRDLDGATTDFQDSSDATTADEKPKESLNGVGRRRCFTRLKSASTSRLNYSPKRSEGWSSPLECLRQQLRKLDDLEDQFPDLACQPYSLRYPFTELGTVEATDTAELEFVRHRALVEREGMRRARQALQTRRAALRDNARPNHEDREATELEVALHRARALLGEKEIRLRHIERSLRRLAPRPQPQETSSASSNSSGCEGGAETNTGAGGAVLRSLRALHADVRDIWRALDARRPHTASPETSSYNAATTSQTRMTLSAPDPMIVHENSDGGVSERARGLRAWLQTTP